MRAGAYALSLLSDPLNVHVLKALEEEPLPLIDLRRAVGSPPETTMRAHLKALARLGLLRRRREQEFPGAVGYDLGQPGYALLQVAQVLEAWLAIAPAGPLEFGSVAARSAIKAVADGWSSAMVRALAARQLSLTELNRLISEYNYPSLERRLSAMRMAGQIEAQPGRSRGTPYLLTDWLRRAAGSLVAGIMWERRYAREESVSLSKLDVEAVFLLAAPLLELPEELEGRCRLVVEIGGARSNGERPLAGVLMRAGDGRVASCVTQLQTEADAWAVGPAGAWLEAMIDGERDRLEVGGNGDLALTLLDCLHRALFSGSRPAGIRRQDAPVPIS